MTILGAEGYGCSHGGGGGDLLLELAGNVELYGVGGADRLVESTDPVDSDELRGGKGNGEDGENSGSS